MWCDDLAQDHGRDPAGPDLRAAAGLDSGGWRFAWFEACSGINCEGLRVGFWNSVLILIPSLILSIVLSIVTGYALALWRCAGRGPSCS
jgi:ABC-type glycerol-3-phosphate transport system permease component